MKINVALFITLLNIVSCKNDCAELDRRNQQFIENYTKFDSPVKDTPVILLSGKYNLYNDIMEMYNKVKLPRMDQYCPNFAIRIQADYNKQQDDIELVSLQLKDSVWSGTYYFTEKILNNSMSSNVSIDSIAIQPKTGWCRFMNELLMAGVLTLPDMTNTKGDSIVMADGSFCIFEIGYKNKYRFYHYFEPELISDINFPEADSLRRIFKCINENFKFK